MRTILSTSHVGARDHGLASETASLGIENWFYDATVTICGPKDPGLQLHLFTGWPASSCRAFVARDPEHRRKIPAEFLRRLLHSEQGEPFFRAFMHGCQARWFTDLAQSEKRAAEAEGKIAAIRSIIA